MRAQGTESPTDRQTQGRSHDWWKSAVVYQIYPRSFADSDGDGIGDLRGIINRLDYLELLGIDVVWLSPICRSPQDDNGYDISDYREVDPVFGTLVEVDELIAGLHQRGIKLVMDLVVNHTSDEHEWFIESRDATSPKRDWYWWRPAREGHMAGAPGAEPNDWQAYFSGSAWQYDEHRGEYFLHQFSKKQPDLNWENPEVRSAVYAMMKWWLDRGVDGFRMDVINLISKNVSLPDGDTFTNCANGPRLHEFLQEMHREVLAGRNLMTVGEAPGATIDVARLCSDAARAELNMVFTFEHMDLDLLPGGSKWDFAPLELMKLKSNLSSWQEGLADAGWNSLYWSNHDQPRAVSRWGNDAEQRVASAKALGTALHLLRGTPYIYQGEEIGMTNAGFTSLDQYLDLESLHWAAHAERSGRSEDSILRSLAVKSRDNARTPMQWDASEHGGFTSGTPWLRSNPNSSTINVEAAITDPDSVFHHYRQLVALRHELRVVVDGDFTPLFEDHEQVFAYVRSSGSTQLLVLANLSNAAATLPIENRLSAFAGMSARIGSGFQWRASSIELAPWAAAAF